MHISVRSDNSEMLARTAAVLTGDPCLASPEDLEEMTSSLSMGPDEAAAYLLCVRMGLDPASSRGRYLTEKYVRPSLRVMDPAPFLSDPCARLIRCAEADGVPETEGIALVRARIPAMTLFPAGDLRVFPDGRVLQPLGLFLSDFAYPSLRDGGREWMSLHPNEILTILPKARACRGRVLCLGLGLGYYLYHAASSPAVESVTVVEKDPRILRWFTRFLLPRFPKADVRLVPGDAMTFDPDPPGYDTVFADLWHDVSDALPLWRRLKEREKPGVLYQYWLDDTLTCYDRGWV